MESWMALCCEPSLEELLADEMMGSVTRSAGTDRLRLRALLRDIARRLPADRLARLRPRCASPAMLFCRPAAG